MINTAESNHQKQNIWVIANSVKLKGNLVIPNQPHGMVVFAHVSDSSCSSPYNQYVAQTFKQSGIATLLIDLLTTEEAELEGRSKQLHFDIGLLAERLLSSTKWLRQNPNTKNLKIGYFGVGTISAAALLAAADFPDAVSAIISSGGRPDLAGSALSRVKAPTLLIVGGEDFPVLEMNRQAFSYLQGKKEIVVIPEATHLFEEAGALDEVTRLATQWFNRYLDPSNKLNP